MESSSELIFYPQGPGCDPGRSSFANNDVRTGHPVSRVNKASKLAYSHSFDVAFPLPAEQCPSVADPSATPSNPTLANGEASSARASTEDMVRPEPEPIKSQASASFSAVASNKDIARQLDSLIPPSNPDLRKGNVLRSRSPPREVNALHPGRILGHWAP